MSIELWSRNVKKQQKNMGGFGFRALAGAYFRVQVERLREYIKSKRARHARKIQLLRLRIL